MVMVVGINRTARGMAVELGRRGASVILASHRKKEALEAAQQLGCRQVQYEALYSTMHDVLVVCDEEKEEFRNRVGQVGIHPGYLKSSMTVMDLTAALRRSDLLREAQSRGCHVVLPRELLLDRLEQQARLFTGTPVPREVLAKALPPWLAEEE
jgi:shikimate 5-dehydrogenase